MTAAHRLAAAGVLAFASPAFAGTLGVVSTAPAGHALTAPIGTGISVTFDRAVDRDTVNGDTFRAFARWSGTVSGTYGYSNGDTTVTLQPDRQLSSGEQVMVILSDALAAADGSPMRAAGYSWQFWTRAMPAPMDFAQVDTRSTDGKDPHSQPYGGVACDVDEDGWLDLSIVTEVTSDLRVFINNADASGTFQHFLVPTPPLGAFASPSEPADFNHDGHVDLAVSNQGPNTVSVLLGNGDGTFGPTNYIAVGVLPNGIAVLDADGDGDVDFVNVNNTSANLCYHQNNGDGTFQAPVFFDAGINGERGLSATDMNNDGILDLAVGGFTPPNSSVAIMLGNGDGTFTTVSTRTYNGAAWMLVTGDVNGDGNADVSTVSGAFNNVNVGAFLLGDGTGDVGAPTTMPLQSWPIASDLGDIDGDGDLDWIAASYNGDYQFHLNDGSGNFTFERLFLTPANASCSLAFDVDNDRDLDLAFVDETADVLLVWKNSGTTPLGDVTGDGSVSFADILALLAAWGPCGSCPEDLNNDGAVTFADILVVLGNWG